MNGEITAVLNVFKRYHAFADQLHAIQAQTIPVKKVLVWHNGGDRGGFECPDVNATHAYNSDNFGVWARFAYALNAITEYVCVFDDDTIPGPRWFENCLNVISEREALLGTIGLLYTSPPPAVSSECSYYNPARKIGWYVDGRNEVATEVDFVGHAWFFKREWLACFWRELPAVGTELCGEDMHFSFMLQKYLGIPTVVPPHPATDPSLWGSTRGYELGRDVNSLWESNPLTSGNVQFRDSMDQFFKAQRRKGWRLINDR